MAAVDAVHCLNGNFPIQRTRSPGPSSPLNALDMECLLRSSGSHEASDRRDRLPWR